MYLEFCCFSNAHQNNHERDKCPSKITLQNPHEGKRIQLVSHSKPEKKVV